MALRFREVGDPWCRGSLFKLACLFYSELVIVAAFACVCNNQQESRLQVLKARDSKLLFNLISLQSSVLSLIRLRSCFLNMCMAMLLVSPNTMFSISFTTLGEEKSS